MAQLDLSMAYSKPETASKSQQKVRWVCGGERECGASARDPFLERTPTAYTGHWPWTFFPIPITISVSTDCCFLHQGGEASPISAGIGSPWSSTPQEWPLVPGMGPVFISHSLRGKSGVYKLTFFSPYSTLKCLYLQEVLVKKRKILI